MVQPYLTTSNFRLKNGRKSSFLIQIISLGYSSQQHGNRVQSYVIHIDAQGTQFEPVRAKQDRLI